MNLETVQIQSTYTQPEIEKSLLNTKQTLDLLFPEQKQADKKIKLAKASLGSLAKEFSATELSSLVAEVEFLVESWLDDYERIIFKGLTLQELLHEKGHL